MRSIERRSDAQIDRRAKGVIREHISYVNESFLTGNDRLGTTAIYLNLIDMHVVDEYTQKW
jgi:hypothetical protein